jgi:DNA topoisomerase I
MVLAVKERKKMVTTPPPERNGLLMEPGLAAKSAGLRHVNDTMPGIRRRLSGKQFIYTDPEGAEVTDPVILGRIKSLAVPPAWQEVWICPLAHGHLQATGRDSRGRKQYRYHPVWRQVRDETKFDRMLIFGGLLPKLRAAIHKDFARQGLSREKVLATVVLLLQRTLIRVGNEDYAVQNRSYGLTTMQDRHASINGGKIEFQFRGKSGKHHKVEIHDPRLARIVKRCQDLPGCVLFQYLDEEGNQQAIDSGDVNEYLRQVTGADFTAKDFRTWFGTVLAARALQEIGPFKTKKQAKTKMNEPFEAVATVMGNTPAVCRKCYIHPAVVESYFAGRFFAQYQAFRTRSRSSEHALQPDEKSALQLLQELSSEPTKNQRPRKEKQPK